MLSIESKNYQAIAAELPPVSETALLARAELLWALRDLAALASAENRERLQLLAEQGGELAAAAGLGGFGAQLQAAAAQLLTVDDLERTAAWTTWADAATGLDLCECAYIRRERGVILADIAGFYAAFGVQPQGPDQRHDQLGRELEYMGVLQFVQARARNENNADGEQVAAAAAEGFWREHLSQWVALPAARAAILPAPEWLRQALAAVKDGCAALAELNAWCKPAWNDAGEADVEAPDEVCCGVGD